MPSSQVTKKRAAKLQAAVDFKESVRLRGKGIKLKVQAQKFALRRIEGESIDRTQIGFMSPSVTLLTLSPYAKLAKEARDSAERTPPGAKREALLRC